MHFIIKGPKMKLPDDPRMKQAAIDAYDKADATELKKVYLERMKLAKHMRLAEYAGRHDLVAKDKWAMYAIRRNMDSRIND